jgi:thioredoxin reductase (NADPH)
MESYDIAVIGAGPCGVAVGGAAKQGGLNAILFDKGSIAASLVDYPYYMRYFSTADRLEVAGVPWAIPERNPSRREAIVYYQRVAQYFQMKVHQYESVESIQGKKGAFRLTTRKMSGRVLEYEAKNIVMSTGGFHAPNMLEVPGEDLPKVHHYFKEPYPYFDQDVVVVGGSNSAVEASLELFRNGARVTLVHFKDQLDRGVKAWVVPDITNRLEMGEIAVHWEHRVAEIKPEAVVLKEEGTGALTELKNDWVVALTGWKPNPVLLRDMGVEIEKSTGIPNHDPGTMETNVPGLYIAGVLAAGDNANKIFIENGRAHGGQIVTAIRSEG